MQDFLPQPGWLHAADQAQQQVHESRGAEVPQHQADEPVLLPQEHGHLQASSWSAGSAGLPPPDSPTGPRGNHELSVRLSRDRRKASARTQASSQETQGAPDDGDLRAAGPLSNMT